MAWVVRLGGDWGNGGGVFFVGAQFVFFIPEMKTKVSRNCLELQCGPHGIFFILS